MKYDYERIFFDSNCSKENGTCHSAIDRVLRKEYSDSTNIRKTRNSTLKTVEKHIKYGGAALISFAFVESKSSHGVLYERHIALFTSISKSGSWLGHNVFEDETNSWLKGKMVYDMCYKHTLPIVWLLTKKK